MLLALAETLIAFALARAPVIIALKIAATALLRSKDVFQPNAAYFMGMLFGCLIRIAPAAALVSHAVWVARKRIVETAI